MNKGIPANIQGEELNNLLPPLPNNWTFVRDDKIYTPETLYDYIDGGAELYLSYDMIGVASRIISREDNEIRIEIFDMGKPGNAFGVFSHTRTTDENQYGQGSQYFPGALIYWKDKYYISITANDENDIIIDIIRNIAGQIDKNITQTGKIPGIIELLPQEDLVKDGFIYFHHYIWLNSYYYITNENLFNINASTDAVLAKYGEKEERSYLMIIEYPDSILALKAEEKIMQELFDHKKIIRIEDDTWMGTLVKANYLIAIFNAPSEEELRVKLETCAEKIPN